jgi:hypothetical protein
MLHPCRKKIPMSGWENEEKFILPADMLDKLPLPIFGPFLALFPPFKGCVIREESSEKFLDKGESLSL